MSLNDLNSALTACRIQSDSFMAECTLPTGFEKTALAECLDAVPSLKAGQDCILGQGRIFVKTSEETFHKVKSLRSIDNISMVVRYLPEVQFGGDQEADLLMVRAIATDTDFTRHLAIWSRLLQVSKTLQPSRAEHDAGLELRRLKQAAKAAGSEDLQVFQHDCLSFRVTCYRSSGKHSFTSTSAASAFGAELNDLHHWVVDLADYDLEVVLDIVGQEVKVCLKLTAESLHRRNITSFGPTTLRPTIAYGLLVMAGPKAGEVVVDPLCGSGSIIIEGKLAFPHVHILGGDVHRKALERTEDNLKYTSLKSVDIFYWDARKLPLKEDTVDAIVTDLPFGKRSGLRKDNLDLYTSLLVDFGRVVRKSGRAVLLTHDSNSLFKALNANQDSWKLLKTSKINVGGLASYAFFMKRI